MRILFAILLFLHLAIHFLGFAGAKGWLYNEGITNIPIKEGFLWLLVSVVIFITLLFFIYRKPVWIILAIPVIIASQVLIILNWEFAKFGSIVNFIILLVVMLSIAGWRFENKFKENKIGAMRANPPSEEIISEKDLLHLPIPVQKYIKHTGFQNSPKIQNFEIRFTGEMREKNKNWFSFRSEQLNTISHPERHFFMKANFKGIPTKGYHKYDGKSARMTIKPLSIFKVVDISSDELLVSEMVTYLNDICLFAPGALIDKKFTWEDIAEDKAKVHFKNDGRAVSAILEINKQGELLNFYSNDRYEVDEMKKFLFSTPVSDYKLFGKYLLPSGGEAIWHYPGEDFVYGKFSLVQIRYNVRNPVNSN